MEKINIKEIYDIFFEKYGPQGWWPVYSLRNTVGRDDRGYFVNPVETPYRASLQCKFEIAVGTILTQNTAWTNVEMALNNLINLNLMDPEIILETSQDQLADAIRPSGYYNQKAKKIKILTRFLLDGGFLEDGNIPNRDNLLGLWGIGEETADSILLYAYNVPVFVIDSYTKRILGRLGIIDSRSGRLRPDSIANLFTDCMEEDFMVYQEYHALIVRHVKEHCRKKPDCTDCVLKLQCSFFRNKKFVSQL